LEIISEVMLHLHVELVWICNARCLGAIGRKNMSCIPERALAHACLDLFSASNHEYCRI